MLPYLNLSRWLFGTSQGETSSKNFKGALIFLGSPVPNQIDFFISWALTWRWLNLILEFCLVKANSFSQTKDQATNFKILLKNFKLRWYFCNLVEVFSFAVNTFSMFSFAEVKNWWVESVKVRERNNYNKDGDSKTGWRAWFLLFWAAKVIEMEEEHEANQSCREEKELSFSINRILQSNDGVKKVDERCNDTIKCRCTVAVQGCQCFSSNTACKISEDRAQDTIIPYPWQMLSKQTSRFLLQSISFAL